MQVSYKRDFNHNYLILGDEEEVDAQGYQVRILLANPPEGLLACRLQTIDNQALFYYEVTAKHTLADSYSHSKIRKPEMQTLFGSLIQTMEEMQAHLLNAGSLLLSPEYIYLDPSGRPYFCFFPPREQDVRTLFQELAEYLLPRIDHTDQEAVILGYSIYRRSMEDSMYLDQIKQELYRETIPTPVIEPEFKPEQEFDGERSSEEELLQSFLEEEEKAMVHPAVSTILIAVTGLFLFGYFYFINNTRFSWQVYVIAAVILLMLSGGTAGIFLLKERRRKKQLEQKPEKVDRVEVKSVETQENNYEDEVDFEAGEDGSETTVLVASTQGSRPRLVGHYPPSLAPILLTKDVMILGKQERAVDVILPSPAISRVHAKIVKEGESYFLCDLNSRNGTFLNQNLINSNKNYKLCVGDEILLADLSYIYEVDNFPC